jgi:putative (di)nucleoside polyphosphate hydrolase
MIIFNGLLYHHIMTDIFRKCASIAVLRESSNDKVPEVLLVHKPRKKDAWQLPQGGVEEEETIGHAALRELHEEAGLKAKILLKSDIVYKYEFPKSYRRFRPDNVCGQRIEFVIATPLESNARIFVDDNEIDNYVWAKANDLKQYIRRDEYRMIVEKLVEEGEKLKILN